MDSLAESLREIKRKARLELVIEWPLLVARWKIILFGAIMQYVHAIFTQLAHRMHQPMEVPLHDVGFAILPELGQKNEWASESIFGTMFFSFVVWTFSPFWMERKRFYTAVLYARVLMVLVVCQALRIISFTVTQLPAPNYHCRLPEPTARRPWPDHWWGHVVVNLARQTTHGCGDLVFSSHTTFALVGVMCYTEYGSNKYIKALTWAGAATLSTLIVASRKHYTVDVVVAWYVVPLVFYAMHRRWTTIRSPDWPHRPLLQADKDLQVVVVAASGQPQKGQQQQHEGTPLLPASSNAQVIGEAQQNGYAGGPGAVVRAPVRVSAGVPTQEFPDDAYDPRSKSPHKPSTMRGRMSSAQLADSSRDIESGMADAMTPRGGSLQAQAQTIVTATNTGCTIS